jgi:hypothetical protein
MGSDPTFWGFLLSALAGGSLLGWLWHGQALRSRRRRWPSRWNLNARPLFNVHERALYRELRATLPTHVILAKVSLLRFCQSGNTEDARTWYDRLQALHVSILVCTPNGVVISAIDIEPNPGKAIKRSQRLKEGVLEACRVRYLRCRPGQWPQGALLQAWALGQGPEELAPGQLHDAGDQLARKLKARRAERAARWAESSFAQDSFFAFDSRFDGAANSMPAPLTQPPSGIDTEPPQAAPHRA